MSKKLSGAVYLLLVIGLLALSLKAFLIFWGIQIGLLTMLMLWRCTTHGEKTTSLPFVVEGILSIIMMPIYLALNPIEYWFYLFAGEDLLANQCWTFTDEYIKFIWDFLHNRKPAHDNTPST
ncbi:hypothetical protein A2318_02555 [Candidatus Uhrbacteria bacterium RIFOXYB2_FULL_45_11]|uniref:Uncharacterized protein n=1 Tax=Candidatus Uhrbacteria bacterium RIFOXYB2_FULL_45_11 TaxID=1802421 RepID=A0A1F7WAF7_9BACT|nr:MAG: hypothetical protein A2318_02555 [Candidatus Uhrbacteria bacterium RIFOXYB2_FULL_45_11]